MTRPIFLDRAARRRRALARLGAWSALLLFAAGATTCINAAFHPAPVVCKA